jgi:hypothetical protein
MKERLRFEKEIEELNFISNSGLIPLSIVKTETNYELKGDWKPEGKFDISTFSSSEQDEDTPISIKAFRFQGISKEVALVFAGVHGSEPSGVTVANKLVDLLKDAASKGKKPKFTTIVIPRLISRHGPKRKRYVISSGKPIEPNRNFPRPGESYEFVLLRASKRKDNAELVDCRSKKLGGDKVMHRILAENRILIQIIEKFQPGRAASIHAHNLPGIRGDGPGIFVDPRGNFNEFTDVPFTSEGNNDDKLASKMLSDSLTLIGPKLPLKDDLKGIELTHPFFGNLADRTGKLIKGTIPTVHYTSTKHPDGTSFGMWAPTPEQSGKRKGVTTITVELPQYDSSTQKTALSEIIEVHLKVLLKDFTELP